MSDDKRSTSMLAGTGPGKDDRQMLEDWLAPRPEVIKRLARAWPPWFCYRSTENPRFHYRIVSYAEGGTLTLLHGADSTLPGMATFGQSPEQLIVCACGTWSEATLDDQRQTQLRMRAWARRPGGAHQTCIDPRCAVCNIPNPPEVS